MNGWIIDAQNPSKMGAKGPKLFDAFREGYLYLLKRFLFLSIHRLVHLVLT